MKIFYKYILYTLVILSTQYLAAQSYNTNIFGPLSPPSSSHGAQSIVGSMSNGATTESIPLGQVTDGVLSHNISLNYTTDGIKVNELSSEVGLGWNLNAGGRVSRTIRGLFDDDKFRGYYHHGEDLSNEDLALVSTGSLDAEPDMYFFAAGGFASYFTIDDEQNFHTIPKSNTIIEPYIDAGDNFKGFLITSETGVKYYFGVESDSDTDIKVEESGLLDRNQSIAANEQNMFRTGWFLKKIESPDGLHQIDFDYEQNDYVYIDEPSQEIQAYYDTDSGNQKTIFDPANFQFNQFYQMIYVRSQVLSSIETLNETIEFDLAIREDLGYYSIILGGVTTYGSLPDFPSNPVLTIGTDYNEQGQAYRITGFTKWNGGKCSKMRFLQDYFQDFTMINDLSGPLIKKLRLYALRKESCDGLVYEPETRFTYYPGNGFAPSIINKAKDHYGFYNQKIENNDIVGFHGFVQTEDAFGNSLSFWFPQ